ncbi:hypothetical protein GGF32_003781 [Allomyces javanicus]|nr:hypothetical protein GGF32_003781 [Allomyces javanicus]
MADTSSNNQHEFTYWYPRRCELEGCNKKANTPGLKACGACKMVQYCCVDHQRKDWKIHKPQCEFFKRLGMKARFYDSAEMLRKYPLMASAQHNRAQRSVEHECGICGITEDDKDMTTTECCNFTIFDVLWRGLNAFNFYPLLDSGVPKHALCETCPKCNKPFMSSMEGCGYVKEGAPVCMKCPRDGFQVKVGAPGVSGADEKMAPMQPMSSEDYLANLRNLGSGFGY